jgi:hypothetical protein
MSWYSDKLQYVSTNERLSVIAGHSTSAAQLREQGFPMGIIASPGK